MPRCRVLNRGINGQRSDEIRSRFEPNVTEQGADVVVIVAGVNDIYQGRTAESVTVHLAAMYERAREAGIPVVAGSIVPYNTATADQNARMRAVNAWIRDAAAGDPNLEFVDTRAAVARPDDPDRLASSPDELHPSADGYRRMAEVIAPAVERALARRATGRGR